MKKGIVKIALSLLLVSGLASCSDFLDINPLDSYSEANVFSDPTMAETYVNTRYTEMRTGWGSAAMRFVCDETMCNHANFNLWFFNNGQLSPDLMNNYDCWSQYYTVIKDCNIFFDNIGKVQSMSNGTRLIGEMRFLRAFYYAELVKRYGGVPIITKTFALDGDMSLKRNTYDECVKFIVDECTEAAKLLPAKYSANNLGRATKGAALALKARMLLYAASPQFNPSNDKTKWQLAADAAKEVIDLKDESGALVYNLDPDYSGLFLNPKSSEIIFMRQYTSEFGTNADMSNSPNGYGGWSTTCILQDMVDSYEMEDGTMPTAAQYAAADGIHSTPWEHRDPRFYASVVCDGQQFRGREVEFWTSPNGTQGIDSEKSPIGAWNGSKTSYSIRKFMNENLSTNWSVASSQPWIFMRLAEVYLNYAEAEFNLGHEGVAQEYVNKIRLRARGGKSGILPDVTASGADLLKAIQHERKIELAFEDHRFFDVRRWKIAEMTENKPARRINIVKNPSTGVKTYTIGNVDKMYQDRKFLAPQHYLFPIPRTEMQRDPLLVQNPGYN